MAITGHASLGSLISYLNLEQRATGDALLMFRHQDRLNLSVLVPGNR